MEPLKQELKPLTKVVSEWVHEYFKKTDLEIAEDGNRATYEFTGEDSGDFNYSGYVEVYEERFAVEVYLYAPVSVPERKRKDVAELLARINFGMLAGQISLNFDSGKIRYKGTLEVKDGALSVAMVNIMVDRGMSILDHFLPAVLDVAHANTSPADAYAKVDEDAPKKEKERLPDADDLSNVWPWERFLGSAPIQAWAATGRSTATPGTSRSGSQRPRASTAPWSGTPGSLTRKPVRPVQGTAARSMATRMAPLRVATERPSRAAYWRARRGLREVQSGRSTTIAISPGPARGTSAGSTSTL